MEVIPVGIESSFDVTFYPDLFVGMSVYDTSGDTPELISGPTLMENVVAGTYIGKFTPPEAGQYVVFKAVYTDEEMTILDSNYSQGSESVLAQISAGGGGGGTCEIIGIVEQETEIVGIVNC